MKQHIRDIATIRQSEIIVMEILYCITEKMIA